MSMSRLLTPQHSLEPEPPTGEELALFQAEMAGIQPLHQDRILAPRQDEQTLAHAARRAAAEQELTEDPEFWSLEAVELLDPKDWISFKRDGVQQGVFRKLRLGEYELQASLDLHGHTLKQARQALQEFLQECRRCEIRCVLIRHGTGEQSTPKALLKSYVSHWLQQWPDLLACHSAQKMHGGCGSLYVLLRKSPRQKLETRERIHRHQP